MPWPLCKSTRSVCVPVRGPTKINIFQLKKKIGVPIRCEWRNRDVIKRPHTMQKTHINMHATCVYDFTFKFTYSSMIDSGVTSNPPKLHTQLCCRLFIVDQVLSSRWAQARGKTLFSLMNCFFFRFVFRKRGFFYFLVPSKMEIEQ